MYRTRKQLQNGDIGSLTILTETGLKEWTDMKRINEKSTGKNERNCQMKKQLRLISAILVVICIGIIIGFTLQTADESSRSSGRITAIITSVFHIEDTQTFEHIIRKLAHFMEYAVFGIVLAWMFRVWRIRKWCMIPVVICLACCDEFIQRFVPGRGASVIDVLIDCAGAVCAISSVSLTRTNLLK